MIDSPSEIVTPRLINPRNLVPNRNQRWAVPPEVPDQPKIQGLLRVQAQVLIQGLVLGPALALPEVVIPAEVLSVSFQAVVAVQQEDLNSEVREEALSGPVAGVNVNGRPVKIPAVGPATPVEDRRKQGAEHRRQQ